MTSIDLNSDSAQELINDLGADIGDSLRGIIEGSIEDLEGFGRAIAQSLLEIWIIPDEDRREALRQELGAQAKLLAEQQRLRVSAEAWKAVDRNLEIVSRVAFTMLRGAVAGL